MWWIFIYVVHGRFIKTDVFCCCRLLFFFQLGVNQMHRSEQYFAGIGVASMDGSNRRYIFKSTDLQFQSKITLDRVNRRIYFTQSLKNQICSINYNGSDWSVSHLHYLTLQCFELIFLTLYHCAVYYLRCFAWHWLIDWQCLLTHKFTTQHTIK